MQSRMLAIFLLALFILSLSPPGSGANAQRSETLPVAVRGETRIPAPEDVLGFRPGDDRKLASWKQVVEYFKKLDAASDRVKFEELGSTTMNAPFVMATISAPENLARLEEFKEIQRRLADPRTLGPHPEREAAQLISRGKTIVLITCGIHSTEVGSYLSSLLIAHRLASSDEPSVKAILRDTIVLLVPSLNPDGVDIVKNWYDETLGTPFEGTEPPTLYHRYTGHDNNRDWYAFTQIETQLTVDKIHNVWHPQIVHDIHQQGRYGARLFLPPYMPPVEPNVPPQIIEGYTELGQAIAGELRATGFKGITSNSTYDAWTPARAYSHYHGGVRILSETASAKIATPTDIKFSELRSREGYDPQKVSDKYSPLWSGGEWRLRNITDYMTSAAFALLRHASQNRVRWLRRFYELGREAVRPRRKGELFGHILRPSNKYLPDVLRRGGVEIVAIKRATIDGIRYPDGTSFIPAQQPYGGFAKALLETQRYPDLRDESGHPIAPYDVTAHTLSLLTGADVKAVYQPFRYSALPPQTEAVKCCADYIPPGEPLPAIYQSHVPSMDKGWTEWVFKQRSLNTAILEDSDIRSGKLTHSRSPFGPQLPFQAIIIPDQSPGVILNGHKAGTMPDRYTGGLGAEGVKALREYVEQGGTLICLNRASEFAIEQFKLPVRDITEEWKRTEFYAPGSILRIELDKSHPVTNGVPEQAIAWVEDSPVFEIKSDPLALVRVRIIARYPARTDALLSGWLLGGERIKGKAALVEVGVGRGRIYLFGFRPQYRGQSLATYPLFFNAVRQAASPQANAPAALNILSLRGV